MTPPASSAMAAPKRRAKRSAMFSCGVKSTIVFGLDHFARHVVDAAQRVGQAQLDAPLARSTSAR